MALSAEQIQRMTAAGMSEPDHLARLEQQLASGNVWGKYQGALGASTPGPGTPPPPPPAPPPPPTSMNYPAINPGASTKPEDAVKFGLGQAQDIMGQAAARQYDFPAWYGGLMQAPGGGCSGGSDAAI